MRKSGILMPVSALPSSTGVGELGPAAWHWIQVMEEKRSENLADSAFKSSWIWKFSIPALFLLRR